MIGARFVVDKSLTDVIRKQIHLKKKTTTRHTIVKLIVLQLFRLHSVSKKKKKKVTDT